MQNKTLREGNYSQYRLLQAILRTDFLSFAIKVFNTLNPGKSIENNWHIQLIASLLQETYEGGHKNLIINIPPRYLKSTLISVAWTAWMMGKDPTKRIMTASYSQSLSTKLSSDTTYIVQSLWYQKLFPHFKIAKDQNRKTKFATTKHGFRLATSVGGTTIGEGGDVLIADDPISPLQASSKKMRNRAISWYKESFSTRLNDKKRGIKVIVMQRLHDDDLVGRIIKDMPDDWRVVNIPAIAEKDELYETKRFSYFRKKGEYLHESREGKKELDEMKRQLGSYAFSAQYQQKPVAEGGGVIKKEWIARYELLPKDPSFIVQSWDLAFTNKSYSDYSICTTWFVEKDKFYLADVYRVQKEFPDLVKDSELLFKKWNAEIMVVEDTVASKAFIQEVKKNTKCRIIGSRPIQDKLTRLAITSPAFESGKIHFPKNASWLVDFENELLSFPETPHDDQIDSTTQFLAYVKRLLYHEKAPYASSLE
jgi:predicted phage terminase large subunit-like protein